MSCIFCSIAKGEVPANVVHKSENVVAFNDMSPQAPVHVLVVPKGHVTGINELGKVLPDIFKSAMEVARIKGIDKSGFRIVMNNGSDAGQAVDHIHFHVLGGRQLAWPPG